MLKKKESKDVLKIYEFLNRIKRKQNLNINLESI